MEKYYTPKLEEFYVGFEYERKEESGKLDINKTNYKLEWIPQIFTIEELLTYSFEAEDNYFKIHLEQEQFRVKYLDQEDIESLGFKYTGKTVGLWFKKEGFFDTPGGRHRLTKYELIYFPNNNELHIEGFLGNDSEGKLFEGIIKNKSEFKKLLKQLNIK
jgi:hypothetical protein